MVEKLPRFILGIDPSQDGTGYGVLDCRYSIPRIAEKGTVQGRAKTWGKTPSQVKLAMIQAKVKELVAKYYPLYEMVFIERGFTKGNNSTQATYKARGAIEAELVGYELVDLPPNTVKLAVAGHGHSTKEEVRSSLAMIFGIPEADFYSLDESDAIAVAYTGYLQHYKVQKESL